jgi:hypothetical protein
VDARAKALGVSRNRVIVEALAASLQSRRQWPPELVRMLEQPLDDATAKALDEALEMVRGRRVNRRRPPKL